MKLSHVAIVLSLLLAGPALAGEGGGRSKESGGGKGSGGSSSSGGGGGAGGGNDPSSRTGTEVDVAAQSAVRKKFWDVFVGWETHGLIWKNNHEGSGRDTVFSYGSFGGGATFLKHNRIDLELGFYVRYLADEGETGARFDDVVLAYTRYVPLPQNLTFSGALRVALPTSFESQKYGMVMAPTVRAALSWTPKYRYARGLTLELRVFGTPYWFKYASAEGGGYNPRGRFGGYLGAEYSLPILKARPFSIGVNAYTAWYWYHNPQGAPGPFMTVPGATSDATFPGQPAQQRYGGEAFVRFTLPSLRGLKADIKVAFADGDSTLGYGSLLHDGVARFYLSYFRTGEFYGALTLRY